MMGDKPMVRTNAATLARLERDRRALRLRAQGMAWVDVGRETGFRSGNAALMAVGRLLRREIAANVAILRALHRERIEMLMRPLWVPAINPGMAQKAARDAGQPDPPSQKEAIELLCKLLDRLAAIEGTRAPIQAQIISDGLPEGRLDVVHWKPDAAFIAEYVRVLRDAGLLEAPVDGQAAEIGPGSPIPSNRG
jgi:hypothetical protein